MFVNLKGMFKQYLDIPALWKSNTVDLVRATHKLHIYDLHPNWTYMTEHRTPGASFITFDRKCNTKYLRGGVQLNIIWFLMFVHSVYIPHWHKATRLRLPSLNAILQPLESVCTHGLKFTGG